jgi:hypothetical protein
MMRNPSSIGAYTYWWNISQKSVEILTGVSPDAKHKKAVIGVGGAMLQLSNLNEISLQNPIAAPYVC